MNEKQTVFVVDDEPAVARAVSRLLRASGYATQVFGSAQEFMECYKPGTRGCLVADFSMPGLSGLDLQQWLADSGTPLPVVFMTGRDDIREAVGSMMQKPVDILTKPVNAGVLLGIIEEALARNRETL